jgi:hypothetical protein
VFRGLWFVEGSWGKGEVVLEVGMRGGEREVVVLLSFAGFVVRFRFKGGWKYKVLGGICRGSLRGVVI